MAGSFVANLFHVRKLMEWDKTVQGKKEAIDVLYLGVVDPTPDECRELLEYCVTSHQKEAPDSRIIVAFGMNREDVKDFVHCCRKLKVQLKTPPPGPGREYVSFK